MYGRTFDADLSGADLNGILHRAYAAGVATALEEPVPEGELERLKSAVSNRYGESLVELAYDEGRTEARTPGGERDAEEVWSSLVEPEGDTPEPPIRRGGQPARRTDLPTSIAVPPFLENRRDELAKLGIPEFLRR